MSEIRPKDIFAFPTFIDRHGETGERFLETTGDGMTLRDWFAGQAVIGLLSAEHLRDSPASGFATRAYGVADAMLERRKETKESAK
jgi:hypothetical protein